MERNIRSNRQGITMNTQNKIKEQIQTQGLFCESADDIKNMLKVDHTIDLLTGFGCDSKAASDMAIRTRKLALALLSYRGINYERNRD